MKHRRLRLLELFFVLLLLASGFLLGLTLLVGCDRLAHRAPWEIDPQGQHENLSAAECLQAGRVPYYIYDANGVTQFYEECLP